MGIFFLRDFSDDLACISFPTYFRISNLTNTQPVSSSGLLTIERILNVERLDLAAIFRCQVIKSHLFEPKKQGKFMAMSLVAGSEPQKCVSWHQLGH